MKINIKENIRKLLYILSNYFNAKIIHMNKEIKAKDLDDLIDKISKEIKKNGNKCNLNHIDISELTSLSKLFSNKFKDFNGDISEWETSNILRMEFLFANSEFNGDISNWDTSGVIRMDSMFTHSKFNNNISDWDVSSVVRMDLMFAHSKFNNNISDWDVSRVHDVEDMFEKSSFKTLPKWY